MADAHGQRALISKRRASLDFARMRSILNDNPWHAGEIDALEALLNGHLTEGMLKATDWLFMSNPNDTTSLFNKSQFEVVK